VHHSAYAFVIWNVHVSLVEWSCFYDHCVSDIYFMHLVCFVFFIWFAVILISLLSLSSSNFRNSLLDLMTLSKKIDFSMIFYNILITLHTLSFIIILLFKEWFNERCICRYALNASVFIFFHNHQVENCTEVVYKHSSVIIEKWFNSWCRLMRTLHLHVMNCIFSLLKIKLIVVNWSWIL